MIHHLWIIVHVLIIDHWSFLFANFWKEHDSTWGTNTRPPRMKIWKSWVGAAFKNHIKEAVEFASFMGIGSRRLSSWTGIGLIGLIGCRSFMEFPRSFPGVSRVLPKDSPVAGGHVCHRLLSPVGLAEWDMRYARYADVEMVEMMAFEIWCHDFSILFSFLWCFSLIFFEFFTRTFSGLVDILILDISLFEGQRLLKKIVVPMTGYYRRHLQNLPESHRVRFSLEGWTKADTSSAIKSWRNWMTKWKNQVTCCCLWWVDLIAMLAMLRC